MDVSLKNIYDFVFREVSNALVDKSECRSIVLFILGKFFLCNLSDVISEKKVSVDKEHFVECIENIVLRLKNAEPIQYILGECVFGDVKLFVDKNVLIPRQETEEMVYRILKEFDLSGKKIVDIGTGSGCIAINIKKVCNSADVIGVDISKDALCVAKKNAGMNNVDVEFRNLDMFGKEIENIWADVIISNPPYVCESEKKDISDRILKYEPHSAIFVKDDDPFIFYRRLKELFVKCVKSAGLIFCEINEKFGNYILGLFSDLKLKRLEINKDMNGKDRWLVAEKYD